MKTETTTRALAVSSRRQVQAVLFGMLATLLAAISLSAWSQPAPSQPAQPPAPEATEGRHGHHHAMGGMRGRGMGPGPMFGGSPERMARMIDHLLDGLGASDEQRNRIKQIAAGAAADIKAQRQAGQGLHQRGMEVFTAPTVDAAAAEQVRQQMLQQHDQASRRMTQAMVEIARVLTPEQRAKIGERMKDRQARMAERMKRMERAGRTERDGRPPPPR